MINPSVIEKSEDNIDIKLPVWAVWLYALLALTLIPWIVYLGFTLPRRHIVSHWDISWMGFDVILFLALVATGYSVYLKSRWVVICASTTGSLLLADAWFDITTEHSSHQVDSALLSAILIEVPLSFISYYVAIKALKNRLKKQD